MYKFFAVKGKDITDDLLEIKYRRLMRRRWRANKLRIILTQIYAYKARRLRTYSTAR